MSQQVETETPTRVDVLPNVSAGAVARAGSPRALVAGRAAEPLVGRSRRPLTLFGPAGLIVSFILMVLLPTAVAAYYYAFVASDIFVSEAKFAVRGASEKLPTTAAGASMAGNLTMMNSNQDAYIVANYIQSGPMLDRLEKDERLRSLFARESVDWLSRLNADAPAERLRKYWSRMASASVDSISGVVSLEVRAFTPEDALNLSRSILKASEELVNDISRRKREDAVRFANEELARAEARVKAAATSMQRFRNETGFLDPVKSAEAVSKLLGLLRAEKIELSNELTTARFSLSANAPSVQVLSARLAALTTQIQDIERELTTQADGEDKTASKALAVYEGLMLEREFSEKFYTTVMALAEGARVEADRQQLYLVTFVQPALAQMALFPRRGADVVVVFACALAVWSVLSLLVAAVRDHDT
ncbi:MAG: lipopolysaccharide biosynthesis protein [Enterovirga sp.]|nr:lipopolysaccharide biosynthesis protein [Enterovirga sp.]